VQVRSLAVRLALGLALGLAGWALPGDAAQAAPARVALLPVVVHTAEKDADYLSLGLADMLSSRLERSGQIAVLRLRGEGLATTDLEAALAAARSAGADYVLFGSFTQFGAGASLDMRCARVEGDGSAEPPEARRVFVQSGTLQEIIPRLDDLSERVARYVSGAAPTESPAGPEAGRPAPASAELEDLRRRVEALERSLDRAPTAPGAPAAGAAAAAGGASPAPAAAPDGPAPERLR
jgi:hypothetical protein